MAASGDVTSLTGKRVLVTGGTTRIGRAIASLLAAHGSRVLVFGREEQPLSETVAEIRAAGGTVDGFTADIGSAGDVKSVFVNVDKILGGIDVLVSNAALAAEGIMDMDDADWRYVVDVNLVGMLACVRGAAERMIAAGGGHIVLIGSMSAEVREKGSSVYVATSPPFMASQRRSARR